MSLWMVRAGRYGEQEQGALNNGVVTIGWNRFSDLSNIKTRKKFSELYAEVYPEDVPNKRTFANQVGQVWRFIHEIKKGDLVALPLKTQSAIAIGKVEGEYQYKQLADNIKHIIKVKWLKTIPRSAFDQDLLHSFGALSTVCQISRNNAENRIRELLQKKKFPIKVNKGIFLTERKIYTDKGDPEIESLHSKYKRGKLIIQPEFQRHFVWDAKKSSKLIESALLDIPLPAIYLYEDGIGKEIIIDGQQRLTAFFSFIDEKFPDGKDFKLTGLKVFTELNKKSYKEIREELQDKIRYCKIRAITFKRESEENLKYEIFERLNTGAVSLNYQELRNCIYRGPYNKLLKNLSKDRVFMYLLGLEKPHKRMIDVERVLRFAAFYHSTYLNYKPPMRRFLDEDMEKYQNVSEAEVDELRNAFKNSITIIKSLLDKKAFKRFYKGNEDNPNGDWEPKKFNASLYDILMSSFAKEDKNIVYRNLDSIREALIYLMTDDEDFINAILIATSGVRQVITRFDKWRQTLQKIIGIKQKEPRCFSFELKQQLYDADPTCSICRQKIQNIDDAAIDHIEQYWCGGKTIPENARLTHRFCNWARPRKD